MRNFNILPNPNTKKGKGAMAVLLSAFILAVTGCGTDKISDEQKPFAVPMSAKDLGPDVLNDKYGQEVLSGRSFQVPAETASEVVCPDLSITHQEAGDNHNYTLSPVRKVDIYPTDSTKLVIRCLYDEASTLTDDIPVEKFSVTG